MLDPPDPLSVNNRRDIPSVLNTRAAGIRIRKSRNVGKSPPDSWGVFDVNRLKLPSVTNTLAKAPMI